MFCHCLHLQLGSNGVWQLSATWGNKRRQGSAWLTMWSYQTEESIWNCNHPGRLSRRKHIKPAGEQPSVGCQGGERKRWGGEGGDWKGSAFLSLISKSWASQFFSLSALYLPLPLMWECWKKGDTLLSDILFLNLEFVVDMNESNKISMPSYFFHKITHVV